MADDFEELRTRIRRLEMRGLATEWLLQEGFATLFASLGGRRAQFDEFAAHVEKDLGVTDAARPQAIRAAARVPEVRAHLKDLLARTRGRIPE